MVVYPEGEIINLIPTDDRSRSFFKSILEIFGPIELRGDLPIETGFRIGSLFMRNPSVFWETLKYIHYRIRQTRQGYNLIGRFLSGHVRFLNVVQHNFMNSRDVIGQRSTLVEKRLNACSFRGAIWQNNQWTLIPMCEINTQRETIYRHQIENL